MPTFSLKPSADLSLLRDSLTQSVPMSIQVEMLNPGIFLDSSFQFDWTVWGIRNQTKTAIDSGNNNSTMQLDLTISRTSLTMANSTSKSVEQYEWIRFDVFVYCKDSDVTCQKNFSPASRNSTLRIALNMRPSSGDFIVFPRVTQPKKIINVTVANWVSGVPQSLPFDYLHYALIVSLFLHFSLQNFFLSSESSTQTYRIYMRFTTCLDQQTAKFKA